MLRQIKFMDGCSRSHLSSRTDAWLFTCASNKCSALYDATSQFLNSIHPLLVQTPNLSDVLMQQSNQNSYVSFFFCFFLKQKSSRPWIFIITVANAINWKKFTGSEHIWLRDFAATHIMLRGIRYTISFAGLPAKLKDIWMWLRTG